MAKKIYEEESIRDIAIAIREKTRADKTYKISSMPEGINEVFNTGELALLNDSKYMNATESGTVIAVNDVSPIEHSLGVKLSSSTITDFTGVEVARYRKNLFNASKLLDYGFVLNGDTYTGLASSIQSKPIFVIPFKENTRYTLSLKGYNTSVTGATLLIKFIYTDGTNPTVIRITGTTKTSFSYTSVAGKTLKSISLVLYSGGEVNLSEIQLEENAAVTEYEPCQKQTATANADGTVEGLTSISPNMTLLSDNPNVIITCQYYRDIDLYIDNLITNVALTGGE